MILMREKCTSSRSRPSWSLLHEQAENVCMGSQFSVPFIDYIGHYIGHRNKEFDFSRGLVLLACFTRRSCVQTGQVLEKYTGRV